MNRWEVRNGVAANALKNRADHRVPGSVAHGRTDTFTHMTKEGFRLGFGYALIGALGACFFLRMMGTATFDWILPVLLYLGLAAAGLSALAGRRSRTESAGSNRWVRTLDVKILAGPGNHFDSTAAFRRDGQAGNAALVGHEIKNYLCTLKGSARLLRQRGPTGDQADILDRIDRVVEKLEVFAEDLGSSRQSPSMGKDANRGIIAGAISSARNPNRCPVNLGDLAQACVRTHFHARASSFQWDTREDVSGLIGDQNRLEQVLLNLYRNAVEAGALKVETRIHREGDRLLAVIEDDGKGCEPGDLRRIFEPFFTTKAGPARRGLGMFIVQSIVESHGGKIRVQSKNCASSDAHGLVFTLDLPLSEVSASRKPVSISPPGPDLVPVAGSKASIGATRMLLALPEPF
jgi:signal transduction histidine kinase